MSMITIGERVPLMVDALTLPMPSTETIDTEGYDVSGLGGVQEFPRDVALILRSDIATTLLNVTVWKFERGLWIRLDVPDAGPVIYPALPLLAGFGDSTLLAKIGVPDRLLVQADGLAGAKISGWIQRVSER